MQYILLYIHPLHFPKFCPIQKQQKTLRNCWYLVQTTLAVYATNLNAIEFAKNVQNIQHRTVQNKHKGGAGGAGWGERGEYGSEKNNRTVCNKDITGEILTKIKQSYMYHYSLPESINIFWLKLI